MFAQHLLPAAPDAAIDQFTPVEFLVSGARRYRGSMGLFTGSATPRFDYGRVRLDPVLGRRISDAYMAAPSWDRNAFAAYDAFCRETVRQFRFLVGAGGLGVAVEVVDYDPYSTVDSMAADIRRRRLKVFATAASGNPHPVLTNEQNDMFRAVHDAFGHAASGRGFDPDGEEAAWLKHCLMYSDPARRALTTETRGQNCAQTFHYQGREFPEQKAVLLPPIFSDPRSVGFRRRPAPRSRAAGPVPLDDRAR